MLNFLNQICSSRNSLVIKLSKVGMIKLFDHIHITGKSSKHPILVYKSYMEALQNIYIEFATRLFICCLNLSKINFLRKYLSNYLNRKP